MFDLYVFSLDTRSKTYLLAPCVVNKGIEVEIFPVSLEIEPNSRIFSPFLRYRLDIIPCSVENWMPQIFGYATVALPRSFYWLSMICLIVTTPSTRLCDSKVGQNVTRLVAYLILPFPIQGEQLFPCQFLQAPMFVT